MLSRDELIRLLENGQFEEFNEAVKGCKQDEVDLSEVDFTNCDLTSADFTRSNCIECNFSESLLNGTDFSYAKIDYCNFTETDLAGAILNEADLSNSDFSCSYNLSACRFDEETVWPDSDLLPEGFDAIYSDDLSSLKDDDDYSSDSDY